MSVQAEKKFFKSSKVWQLSDLVARELKGSGPGSVVAVAIDDGPYLALAELAAWRRRKTTGRKRTKTTTKNERKKKELNMENEKNNEQFENEMEKYFRQKNMQHRHVNCNANYSSYL